MNNNELIDMLLTEAADLLPDDYGYINEEALDEGAVKRSKKMKIDKWLEKYDAEDLGTKKKTWKSKKNYCRWT